MKKFVQNENYLLDISEYVQDVFNAIRKSNVSDLDFASLNKTKQNPISLQRENIVTHRKSESVWSSQIQIEESKRQLL